MKLTGSLYDSKNFPVIAGSATVYRPDKQPINVMNLRWLFRYRHDVVRFSVNVWSRAWDQDYPWATVDHPEPNHLHTAVLRAELRDGTVYVTTFASREVLQDVLRSKWTRTDTLCFWFGWAIAL